MPAERMRDRLRRSELLLGLTHRVGAIDDLDELLATLVSAFADETGAERGSLACHRVTGWWEDAGTQESLPEIGALIGRTGVNKLA